MRTPSRSSAAATGRNIDSTGRTASAASLRAADARMTYPAPARIAACAAMIGAPVVPGAPPHTTTVPDENFEDAAARLGNPSSTPSPMSPTVGTTGGPGGIPIPTTVTDPAHPFPGWTHSPGFAAWNVAVASARTATPETSPVDPFTPDGMSAEITTFPAAFTP